MYTKAIIAFGLATVASAHMKMSSPVPYGASSLDNSPLDASGSDFPCKQRSGVYEAEGASNVYAQGASGSLAFIGSAVHGGGSCQVSITYDAKPDKNSVWKVIKSIEGGCPAKNAAGNLGDNANQANQDKYDFQIPDDMPAGNGTIAWTWFNKVGNREMYMNCGPVTITGSEGSQESYSALPDMFVANLASINDCAVPEGTDVQFPNAGKSVDVFGTALGGPKGNCGASSGGGSGGGSDTPKLSTTAGNGGAPTAAPTSAPVVSSKPSASKPTASASLPGGVFITVPANNGGVSATPTASATKAPAVTPSAAPSAAPSSGTGSGSGSGNGTETPSTGAGAQTVGSACTDEGAWNCVGGSSFQRCASGTWSSVQQLAGGTSCTAGMGSELSMVVTRNGRKRALRQRSLRFRSA
ncbi:glycoside hydrolase [Colletotrichum incanum]|uniref:Glycoside hydrolase n=1 Tax=Colletotrichum incanum TaxID=1573173 RepID=A0A167C397_COLIC|nr:glycoside hydrolase [Colletotrichum incanum]